MSKVSKSKRKGGLKEAKCGFSKCSSKDHGDKICEAIRKGGSTDDQSISYITQLCGSFFSVLDSDGRSALHNAALVGKNKVVRYLLAFGANINLQEKTNKWSALHLSCVAGEMGTALILLKNGVDTKLLDKNGHMASHYLCHRLPHKKYNDSKANLQHVYCWGTNANYNLGLSNAQSKEYPEYVEFPFNDGSVIKHISMNKFHTVFLTVFGDVYTCGHGVGGRLGLDSDSSLIVPQHVQIQASKNLIIEISTGVDHTLYCNANNEVFSCGLNRYHQLGFSPCPDQVSSPRLLTQFHAKFPDVWVAGICAATYHSVIWSSVGIYTCGMNGGQLGHQKTKEVFIDIPQISYFFKKLHEEHKPTFSIKEVVTSDGAIVFVSGFDDIFVCCNYEVRKIMNRHKKYHVKKIACSGGSLEFRAETCLIKRQKCDELAIALLSSEEEVIVWQNDVCLVLEQEHSMPVITDICLNSQSFVVVNSKGNAYITTWDQQQSTTQITSNKRDRKKSVTSVGKLSLAKRLPYLYRTRWIFSDPSGKNYMALQHDPVLFVSRDVNKPANCIKEDISMFYTDKITENISNYDVEIVVDKEKFPANSFLLSWHSKYFHTELVKEKVKKSNNITNVDRSLIDLPSMDKVTFRKIMELIYKTYHIEIYDPDRFIHTPKAKESEKSYDNRIKIFRGKNNKLIESFERNPKGTKRKKEKNDNNDELNYPIKPLLHASNQLIMEEFQKFLLMANEYDLSEHSKRQKPITFLPDLVYNREKFSEFWDVALQCDDGKVIRAHKCILVARSTYFETLLGVRWCQSGLTTTIDVSLSSSILQVVLDYLYTNGSPLLDKSKDINFVCEVLVTAHPYMLEGLHLLCQSRLFQLLTLKNAIELLRFSNIYDASSLKAVIDEYICLNLEYYFDFRIKDMDYDVIEEVDSTFKSLFAPLPWILRNKGEDDELTCEGSFASIISSLAPSDILFPYPDDDSDRDRYSDSDVDWGRFDEMIWGNESFSSEFSDDTSENGNSCKAFKPIFMYVPASPVETSKYFTKVQATTLPTHEDLELALKKYPSIVNETPDDWSLVEVITGSKPDTRTDRKRKTPQTKRPRKPSHSSRRSTSSNSESETTGAFYAEPIEQLQFSFDDLEDRVSQNARNNSWQVAGRPKSSFVDDVTVQDMENGLQVLEIKSTEINKMDSDQTNCVDHAKSVEVVTSSPTLSSRVLKNFPIKSFAPETPFPTLTESLSMGSVTKDQITQGKRIPKFSSSKFGKKSKKSKSGAPKNEECDLASPTSSSCPWGNSASLDNIVPLSDIMKCEATTSSHDVSSKSAAKLPQFRKRQKSHGHKADDSQDIKITQNCTINGASNSRSLEEQAERSGWNRASEAACSSDRENFDLSFSSIVEEEIAYRKTVQREQNKPLSLIQLEEKAIKELFEFYGGESNPEERVTVRRRESHLGKPSWNVPNRYS